MQPSFEYWEPRSVILSSVPLVEVEACPAQLFEGCDRNMIFDNLNGSYLLGPCWCEWQSAQHWHLLGLIWYTVARYEYGTLHRHSRPDAFSTEMSIHKGVLGRTPVALQLLVLRHLSRGVLQVKVWVRSGSHLSRFHWFHFLPFQELTVLGQVVILLSQSSVRANGLSETIYARRVRVWNYSIDDRCPPESDMKLIDIWGNMLSGCCARPSYNLTFP